MLSNKIRYISLLITLAIGLSGVAYAQPGGGHGGGYGGGGHGGGGHGGGHGGGGNGGCNPDSLVLIELSGIVLVDSIAFGFMHDSSGTCGGHDSSFYWGGDNDMGNGYGGNGHGYGHGFGTPGARQDPAYHPMIEEMRDSLHAVYSLDVDDDGVEDYVLNFGPSWYTPEDSTLTRPEEGAYITVSGVLMEESPMWDLDVVVVTSLNGEEWRELGPQGGGMMPGSMGPNPIFGRHENSPNPFNPSTVISFELLTEADVSISIYDVGGREIRSLSQQRYMPGYHQLLWDGMDHTGVSVPSGVYLYMIQSGTIITSKQITLLR